MDISREGTPEETSEEILPGEPHKEDIPPEDALLRKKRRIIAVVELSVLVIGIVLVYVFYGKRLLTFFSSPTRVKAWLDGLGPLGVVVFIAIRAAQTLIKVLPAEVLEIGAGYAYGTWAGLLFCMIGTVTGTVMILFLMKKFGTKLLYLFVSKEKLESVAFLKDSKKLGVTLFFLYLISGTPKDIITYMIGLTPMKKRKFLLITCIARIPSVLVSTWCGAAMVQENYLLSAVIFGATTIVSLLCMFLYRIYEKKKKKKLALAEAPAQADE